MVDITSMSLPCNDVIPISQKSVGLAVLLAILIPGAGQIYAERVLRGLCILVVGAFITPLFGLVTVVMATEAVHHMGLMAITGLLITFLPWLYGIVDSCLLARRWNQELRNDPYRRPW